MESNYRLSIKSDQINIQPSRKLNFTYTCRADQVVGMGSGAGVIVMGHTADHHHGGALEHYIVSQAAPADGINWENGDELRQRQTETLTI